MFPSETRILVVDDASTIRNIVVKSCEKFGFHDVLEAGNGKEGWEAIQTSDKPPVGLVICDWNMPVMTGLELLNVVRGDPRFANLPFIMLTAEADANQVMEAIKAKVTNYIIKPFTADTLLKKLEATYAKTKGGK